MAASDRAARFAHEENDPRLIGSSRFVLQITMAIYTAVGTKTLWRPSRGTGVSGSPTV